MRRVLIVIVLFIVSISLAAPALAGGWAAVRLDEIPGEVRSDTPWRFGFMVLQHDVTPISDVTPVVRAVNKATGEEITATARQEGAVGHFVAELTLPAGDWKWAIRPEPFAATSFETLRVVDGDDAESLAQDAEMPRSPARSETIAIDDAMTFQPATLEVDRGTTITWRNDSSVAHSVMGEALTFDDSSLIDPGQSYSATFNTPGTYRYICAPHPFMEGTIVVE